MIPAGLTSVPVVGVALAAVVVALVADLVHRELTPGRPRIRYRVAGGLLAVVALVLVVLRFARIAF